MLDKYWYSNNKKILNYLLSPISLIFKVAMQINKSKKQKNSYTSKLPIIVVGNISVGGTGKTPIVLNIANFLHSQGNHPAIITRGYGGKSDIYPLVISDKNNPMQTGDEPFMMFNELKALNIPICVGSKRIESVKYLEKNHPQVNVIISDDGLQHYALNRDYEIAVVDGYRVFGNKMLIPAGPLRESAGRIKEVNAVIINGKQDSFEFIKNLNKNSFASHFKCKNFVNLKTSEKKNIYFFANKDIFAMAGIGNPSKFFDTLNNLNVNIIDTQEFKDHHTFTQDDFTRMPSNIPIVMTSKDAIKCKDFAKYNFWYLDIDVNIDNAFYEDILNTVRKN